MTLSCLIEDGAMLVLGKVMKCPCCGPPWYRDLAVRWYERHGLPVPPELGGPRGEYSRPEGP